MGLVFFLSGYQCLLVISWIWYDELHGYVRSPVSHIGYISYVGYGEDGGCGVGGGGAVTKSNSDTWAETY